MRVAAPLPAFENARARLPGPDLVRSLAILCVLACHDGIVMTSWWHRAPPLHVQYLGFHGVALFFALSGFLIGTIMLDLVERDAPLREWGVFLVRRWLRTLPAYYAWLLVVLLPLAWLGPFGATREEVRRVLPRFLTLSQNLWTAPVSGWFGVSWSLAVEEWFYLLFPLGLLMLWRGCGLRRWPAFAVVLGVFLVLPLGWRLSLPLAANWSEETSKVVFCRLDSIACGVGMAWAYRRWTWVGRRCRVLLAVGAGLACFLWWQDRLPRIGTPRFHAMADFDLLGLGYALCLPAMMRLRRLPVPVAAAVRGISTLSYPLYLCHLPLVLLAGDLRQRFALGPWDGVALAAVLTVGGAAVSWHLVEKPFLHLRPRQWLDRRRTPWPGLGVVRTALRGLPASAQQRGRPAGVAVPNQRNR